MDIPYDLTCWYLNVRRVCELTGALSPADMNGRNDNFQKIRNLIYLKNQIVAWLEQNNPQPLEKLIVEEKLAVGSMFTHHSNFFFSGLSKVADALRKGKSIRLASAYSKLEDLQPYSQLSFDFHHEHLTSSSSWHELSRQKRAFVLGLITDISDGIIKLVPYVIANIISPSSEVPGWSGRWWNHLEIHLDSIESFAAVTTTQRLLSKQTLESLRSVPEKDIKAAFAEIINEPMVPKDWGGESSDLFSSRLLFDGNRTSTAFLFKGPAAFKPMTLAELGKNGDQISRLFDEPADLFVLQHCHEVTSAVRKTMRAFAQQMGRPRLFCIIDGYDTIRVLESYSKCGFEPSPAMRPQGAA
jgi:hypothetical protein